VPNRLRIEIHERTPAAFARIGFRIFLIDNTGTLMDLPVAAKRKYSFPVILGMSLAEPISMRAARMKLYGDLIGQLDSGGARHSQDLSEVDLSDQDDVKVLASDPGGEVLVHLGSSNYLDRYKIYVAHVQEWRQQFTKLQSVDLRYDQQIIVNPDLQGAPHSPPLAPSVARAAMAGGVKPAALITHELTATKPLATPPTLLPASKAPVKPIAVRKKTARARHWKAVLKKASANQKIASGHPYDQVRGSSAGVPPTVAPRTAMLSPTPKPSSIPPASTTSGTDGVKPGNKPSPAIPKGQENP
jgi:cell division protein FtsQ